MREIRYGIFLRPDPETCWSVTQITSAVRAQFGLVSAGAFPPHVTLIGNLATDATVDEITAVLDPVFEWVSPFAVYNPGVKRGSRGSLQYDINWDVTGQEPNAELNSVARDVKTALLPISRHVEDFLVIPVQEYQFSGHLGLASHELMVDPGLSEQVAEFIEGLPITAPASFVARWYSLFEFTSDWTSHWWETMTWRHLKSWEVK